MIIVSAVTTVSGPGHRERLAELLVEARVETMREPGVIEYQISTDVVDPHILYSLEVYTSGEAIAAHLKAPHMQKVLAEASAVDAQLELRSWVGAEPFDIATLMHQLGH